MAMRPREDREDRGRDRGRDRDKDNDRGRGSGRSSFEYKPRSKESVQKRAEQRGGRFDAPFQSQYDVWRPHDGSNLIRILPPTWPDAQTYAYDVWVHEYVGAEGGGYLCLQKMQGKYCPICKAMKDAQSSGDQEEAAQLKPREKRLVWIIDRDDEKMEKPAIWMMSWTMERDIAALTFDKRRDDVVWIDHPEEGYDLSFTRSGKKLNTRYYGIQIDRKSSPIDEDEKKQAEILEYIKENPLPDTLLYRDASYLEGVLEGTVGGAAPDDDDKGGDDRREKRGRDDDDDTDRGRDRDRGRDDDDDADRDRDSDRGRGRDRDADDDRGRDRGRSRVRANNRDDDDRDRGRDDDDDDRGRRRGRDDDDADEGRGRGRDDDDTVDEERPRRVRASRRDDDNEGEEKAPDDERPRRVRAQDPRGRDSGRRR